MERSIESASERSPWLAWTKYARPLSMPFWGVHVAAIWGVIAVGVPLSGIVMTTIAYFLGMFFVTAVYHRYFSHRTYKTSRVFQFILAFFAQMTAQKGVLWWASHHRHHHKHSDEPGDVHSVRQRGFFWSHIGWIVSTEWEATDMKRVADLARYPELRFLNIPGVNILPSVLWAVLAYWLGGGVGLVWGYFVPTVLVWHGTFTVNSLAHLFGNRPFETTDDSRNNALLAIFTMGEGWHNNHHHYQSSVNQGFRWYQIDLTYYGILLLERLHLVWDLRKAPREISHPETNTAEVCQTLTP